ncbi:hypothetical protein CAPTEDRAFT_215312 [Capitella teleta]|uniref:SCP domain-containing protein n=1 Tax=Capitella teleta TaxID=283909 RepID=R7UUC7_CAPTE|nr:hypothetical protein CAPTEDRAFT_215312 [Capitella teleta]|eukprot:ELU10213.1 hypothetical protein CAPTEDRAFT_215312 [Capitella teleta]
MFLHPSCVYTVSAQSSFFSVAAINAFDRRILELHNNFRSFYSRKLNVADMKMMVWDPKLARIATKLTSSCNVEASMSQLGLDGSANGFGNGFDNGLGGYGVNTKAAPTGSMVLGMISEWIMQYSYYSTDFHMCLPGHKCDAFMQMAASKNDRLGCSLITNCGNNQILTCVYSPGVSIGDVLYQIGQHMHKYLTMFCRLALVYLLDHSASLLIFHVSATCNPSTQTCDCKKTCAIGTRMLGVLDRGACACFCTSGFGPNCDEECKNPEQYLDYDICAFVTDEECSTQDQEMAQMLREFCPEQCVCNRRSVTYESK